MLPNLIPPNQVPTRVLWVSQPCQDRLHNGQPPRQYQPHGAGTMGKYAMEMLRAFFGGKG